MREAFATCGKPDDATAHTGTELMVIVVSWCLWFSIIIQLRIHQNYEKEHDYTAIQLKLK